MQFFYSVSSINCREDKKKKKKYIKTIYLLIYLFLGLLVDSLAKFRQTLFNLQNIYMPTPNPHQWQVTLLLQKAFDPVPNIYQMFAGTLKASSVLKTISVLNQIQHFPLETELLSLAQAFPQTLD